MYQQISEPDYSFSILKSLFFLYILISDLPNVAKYSSTKVNLADLFVTSRFCSLWWFSASLKLAILGGI